MSIESKKMGLRDIGETLPPGFRFYPSDEELVCHYLYKKICNEHLLKGTLVEIDLHTCEPWQLPDVAKLNASEWYFFSFRDRKYATGYRTNRATKTGYWKATGKDRTVIDPETREVVGMRKTLVFYRNRAPNGIKSGWIMHEFRLETPHMPPKEDWVLCRVFHKSKRSENSMEALSPQHNLLENIDINASSRAHRASSPTPLMPNYAYQYHQTTPFRSSSALNNNSANYPVPDDGQSAIAANPSATDDFGFLWDMNMEDNGLENHGMPHDFGDINSMVFL